METVVSNIGTFPIMFSKIIVKASFTIRLANPAEKLKIYIIVF